MLRAEPLDDRICPTATLSNGTLTITGTNINDTVLVSDSGSSIVVYESYGHAGAAPIVLPPRYFPQADVTGGIVFYGNDGDDSFTTRLARSVAAYGGNGNDTLTVGALGDRVVFSGDAGDDTITGGFSSDKLFGGDGNDVIKGGHGNDGLTGGTGDDYLVGGADRDGMFGGAGNDTFDGSPDGVEDTISGGSGYDVVYGAVPTGFDPLDQVTGVELWIL